MTGDLLYPNLCGYFDPQNTPLLGACFEMPVDVWQRVTIEDASMLAVGGVVGFLFEGQYPREIGRFCGTSLVAPPNGSGYRLVVRTLDPAQSVETCGVAAGAATTGIIRREILEGPPV